MELFRVSPLVRQQPPNCQSHAQLQVQEISVRVLVVLVLQFCYYCFRELSLECLLSVVVERTSLYRGGRQFEPA